MHHMHFFGVYKHTIRAVHLCQDACEIEMDRYFSLFCSAVPVHLVPSTSHSFHDGIVCVAARMSEMTFSLRSRRRIPLADPPLAFIGVINGICGSPGLPWSA